MRRVSPGRAGTFITSSTSTAAFGASVVGSNLGAVVQQELARLLAERGLPADLARGGEVASLDGGEFQVKQGSKAQEIGAQIAQAVYGGLAR